MAKKKKYSKTLNGIQKVAAAMEAGTIEEFIDIKSRPMRLIFWNFVIGLSRGVGFFIGATIAGALVIAVLKAIFVKLGGMPWIGEKAADFYLMIKQFADQAASSAK